MAKLIPEWANKALIQFIPQVISLPTVRINLTFPEDLEEVQELLDSWEGWKLHKSSQFTINELQPIDPLKPTERILRQVMVDLRTVLFIEVYYYGEVKK